MGGAVGVNFLVSPSTVCRPNVITTSAWPSWSAMNLRTLGSASTLMTAVSSWPSRPMTGRVGPAAVSEIDTT